MCRGGVCGGVSGGVGAWSCCVGIGAGCIEGMGAGAVCKKPVEALRASVERWLCSGGGDVECFPDEEEREAVREDSVEIRVGVGAEAPVSWRWRSGLESADLGSYQ